MNRFVCLTTRLSGQETADLAHHELEELIDCDGRELLRQLFQDHLDRRAVREEQAPRSGALAQVHGVDGRVRPHRESGHSRMLACLFGHVRVCRAACRGKGLSNVHPADRLLSLPAGRHSMGLRRLAVTEAVRGSFDQPKRRSSAAAGK